MPSKRLTVKELAAFRAQQLAAQDGVCAICGQACELSEAVVDHDHKTGVIRGVLHRGCNAMLGHLENNRARNGMSQDVRLGQFLRGVSYYISKRRTDAPLYPSYRTTDEKRELRNKRARAARAAKKGQ